MNISHTAIVNTLDGRFIKFLREAYITNEELDKNIIAKKVAYNLSTNRYHNTLPELLIDFNKGNGVSRPVPVFHPEDYFVYYFCIKKLENKLAINRVSGTYGGWSLSGLNRDKETAESMESVDSFHSGLNPAAGAQKYGEFNMRIKQILDNAPDDVCILEIDIANFYDCIRIDHLQRQIRAVSSKGQLYIVDLLFYFIANCSKLMHSYRPQSTGIPQDMIGDCSRILANFYLQEYDAKIKKICDKHGITYLRFADDQLFIIPQSIRPAMICREASKALYRLGLNINQKKVKVWEKNRLLNYRCIPLFDLLDLKKVNANQDKQVCNEFTQLSLEMIKKSRSSNNEEYKIKDDGLPLIKKIIGLNINKLTIENRKRIIKEILNPEGFLKYLPEYHLTKLYKKMNHEERIKLIDNIKEVSENEIHANFDYEVMKFMRNNKLNWKSYAKKVKNFTNEWRYN